MGLRGKVSAVLKNRKRLRFKRNHAGYPSPKLSAPLTFHFLMSLFCYLREYKTPCDSVRGGQQHAYIQGGWAETLEGTRVSLAVIVPDLDSVASTMLQSHLLHAQDPLSLPAMGP